MGLPSRESPRSGRPWARLEVLPNLFSVIVNNVPYFRTRNSYVVRAAGYAFLSRGLMRTITARWLQLERAEAVVRMYDPTFFVNRVDLVATVTMHFFLAPLAFVALCIILALAVVWAVLYVFNYAMSMVLTIRLLRQAMGGAAAPAAAPACNGHASPPDDGGNVQASAPWVADGMDESRSSESVSNETEDDEIGPSSQPSPPGPSS
ncbi:hypothetical protein C8A00DRAFT_37225 [Chaetomidium leptoderma]|uniref:Uncharacterized protein n=1 Tax=Chaetomidium leptoderma TaxID=669021 RepID=A0AAN6ZU55_9PEZI|nr:hypothetical protein C8A00DRAFT_37225 [Chaetomidium leptoderma]